MDGGAVLCLAVDGFRAASGAADRGRPFVQRGTGAVLASGLCGGPTDLGALYPSGGGKGLGR